MKLETRVETDASDGTWRLVSYYSNVVKTQSEVIGREARRCSVGDIRALLELITSSPQNPHLIVTDPEASEHLSIEGTDLCSIGELAGRFITTH